MSANFPRIAVSRMVVLDYEITVYTVQYMHKQMHCCTAIVICNTYLLW